MRVEREQRRARASTTAMPPARSIERSLARSHAPCPRRCCLRRRSFQSLSFLHRIYCIVERTESTSASGGRRRWRRHSAAAAAAKPCVSLPPSLPSSGGRTVTAAAVLADGAAAKESLLLLQLPVRRHSKNISPRDRAKRKRQLWHHVDDTLRYRAGGGTLGVLCDGRPRGRGTLRTRTRRSRPPP